ncbi:hypothetical protein CEXT_802591 [Caerostris extrusa]|uniref:Uncharacterized protein n=1 Tax=Caerostris extrusa TaxID=172846 RepID=A0AAV4S0C1_CAEEX|nr:hypothetical protein CEXT_802591 [Caerostris extrusa]
MMVYRCSSRRSIHFTTIDVSMIMMEAAISYMEGGTMRSLYSGDPVKGKCGSFGLVPLARPSLFTFKFASYESAFFYMY